VSSAARIKPKHTTAKSVQDLQRVFGLQPANAAATAGDSTVVSVASDNRQAAPGDLFVALPGARAHGAKFAPDAIARGATAVLTDAAGAEMLGDVAVPVFVTPDPRRVLGPVAEWVYERPATKMLTFAVTGTNGKTTTAFQLDHLLAALGQRTGLIGTVLMRSGDKVLASTLTTPEAADLQALLAAMVEDGVQALAMEASSHALAQHRVDPVVYDVAGFTNLTRDHLDFHDTMDEYFAAKALLFTPDHAKRAVITVDDEYGVKMAQAATIPVATLFTGTGEIKAAPSQMPRADWTVRDIAHSGTGSAFTLAHRDGRELRTTTSLPGDFNVANAALALTMVLESGAPLGEVAGALAACDGLSATVPGRMEVISAGDVAADQPRVLVDFAHNTEALELALNAVRGSTRGKLIVVFGAAGDRDAGKRPDMGKVAVAGADLVVVTDDDPHGEDPAAVRAGVMQGARPAAAEAVAAGRAVEVVEIPDRQTAIWQAIADADAQDTVLVAGRGHETIQEVAGDDLVLDDRVEARAALARRAEGKTA